MKTILQFLGLAIGVMACAVAEGNDLRLEDLPAGSAPESLEFAHFPTRAHAVIWRNWTLVPIERIARVLNAEPEEVVAIGKAMGLEGPPEITSDQLKRSSITIIRRNWHLLPYEQLLGLLKWTPAEMEFALREDDFLYIKLGSLKPKSDPVRLAPRDEAVQARERAIARIVREEFPPLTNEAEPLFTFVDHLSAPLNRPAQIAQPDSEDVRFCYSYFALYGDPLLETEADPYPDGLLARMAEVGVKGVWLQGVLPNLAPYPWAPELSERHQERLANLATLVARAKAHGMGVYLYLNEPRSRPLRFFEAHPELKGVTEGHSAAVCTSAPEVKQYLTDSIATIVRAVPDLAGFFTITASENLTNCWSHGQGAACERCASRGPAEVIAEVNALIDQGIEQGGGGPRLIAWDWGWGDEWAPDAIGKLPAGVTLQSVSEWSIPIERGGVKTSVGEYSISVIGPGPRAKKHWAIARERGIRTNAKIQAGNTWELSAVPYIPAVANVARHVANLREEKVDGLMLGWTLGGYPSPNLEVANSLLINPTLSPEDAMLQVASRRFGEGLAPTMVSAWTEFSDAFSEFPYHGGLVYNAPMQYGPSNLLWEKPTGYRATMVGFPYDDLDAWRAVYPPEVFISQFEKVAGGFDRALEDLNNALAAIRLSSPEYLNAIHDELRIAEAAAIHFRTCANQARFVLSRRELESAQSAQSAREAIGSLERLISAEIDLAKRLYALQTRDSRIGFEASNQYYYVPADLIEKALNGFDLLERWLPAERKKWGIAEAPPGADLE